MTNDKTNWPTDAERDALSLLEKALARRVAYDESALDTLDCVRAVVADAITAIRAQHADHEAEIARLTAERDAALAMADRLAECGDVIARISDRNHIAWNKWWEALAAHAAMKEGR